MIQVISGKSCVTITVSDINRDHREKSRGGERQKRDTRQCKCDAHARLNLSLFVVAVAEHTRASIAEEFAAHAVVHIAD